MPDVEPESLTATTTVRTAPRPRQGGDTRTDGELLWAARSEPTAFGEFYLRHANRLYTFFRHRCGDPQDAFDLVSETFAQALHSLRDFDPAQGEPGGWLFGIAKNKLRHYARRGAVESRARHRMSLDVGPLGADALDRLEEMIDLRDVRERLEPALTELPPTLGRAVRLRCLDGRSYDEVARLLEINPAAARKRVSCGLEQLEHLLPTNPFVTHD